MLNKPEHHYLSSTAWWFLGDWFEVVLCQLEPCDTAACRLVSRSWRQQVSLSLASLSTTITTSPGADLVHHPTDITALTATTPSSPPLPAVFPNLSSLCCTFAHGTGKPCLKRTIRPALLPAVSCLSSLRTLELSAPHMKGLPTCVLCHVSMRHLGSLPHLEQLALEGVGLCGGKEEWRAAAALTSLMLSNCTLCGEASPACMVHALPGCPTTTFSVISTSGSNEGGRQATLPGPPLLPALSVCAVLAPLAPSLRQLALRGRVAPGAGHWRHAEPAGCAALGPKLGLFKGLEVLEVDGDFCLTPGEVREVCGLPGLRCLTLRRPVWARLLRAELALCDADLAELAELAQQLQSLALAGHPFLTPAAMDHVQAFTHLTALDLRFETPPSLPQGWPGAGVPPSLGLQQLSRLRRLQAVTLGGAPVGDAACEGLASLPLLTALHLLECEALDDKAVHRLSCLRALHELSLVHCPRVTDIGVALLTKHITRLTSLDLTGCYTNLTDRGVAALGALPALHRLSLAHCQHVTDGGLHVVLPKLKELRHLVLRGCCQLGDASCRALAVHAVRLESLDLGYCREVGGEGLAKLAALRMLHTLRVHQCGISQSAVREVAETKAGRRLRVESGRACWWIQGEEG